MPEIVADVSAAAAGRYAIVAARFNESITVRLVDGARAALRDRGVAVERVTVAWVPGSFEIPLAARRLAGSGRFAAVVCVGCLIRGETSHYDLIATSLARGMMETSLATGVPITLGVLAVETPEQAQERAGGRLGNLGAEAAQAAFDMVGLLAALERIEGGEGG